MVYPIYGYGWTTQKGIIETPSSFHVTITDFFKRVIVVDGFSGRIVESNHIYNAFYMRARLRHFGTYNFMDKTGDYNIEISNLPFENKEGGS